MGDLIDESLDDQAFDELEQRLEHYLRSAADMSQKEMMVAELRSELEAISQDRDKVQTALQASLTSFELNPTDLETTVEAYLEQSERKKTA